MVQFSVTAKKVKELAERMRRLDLKEGDFVEKFVRSSGRGGQNVNKTATCVYLKHEPTGIEVKCSSGRSQAYNRFMARRILSDKIEEIIKGKESEKRQRIEKIRRQKRKRSKRAKEKMLDDKKKKAAKKFLRKPLKQENNDQ